VKSEGVGVRVDIQLYPAFIVGGRWGCVVNATPQLTFPWEGALIPIVQGLFSRGRAKKPPNTTV